MKVIAKTGRENIAVVYIGETEKGQMIEFVESLQPPKPRNDKWVLVLSTLFGCPVKCMFCDAGGLYKGKLSYNDMIDQINYMVLNRFPDKNIPVKKFKIQFSRMGEPSLNKNVLDVIENLPDIYNAPGLIPCISTIAPENRGRFFNRLLEIKKKKYKNNFQLQFSIHSTDDKTRDRLIPTKKWSLGKIAAYGKEFYNMNGRKISLNFALTKGVSVDSEILFKYFDPLIFLIKITPLNPTFQAKKNNLESAIVFEHKNKTVNRLRTAGYDVILSIGELEENKIGSNCGQYISSYKKRNKQLHGAYSYSFVGKQK